jgi:hypothetical protein
MKVALTLMTLATMAISGTQASRIFDHKIPFPTIGQNGTIINSWGPQVRYFSSLGRGFIQGYRRGMYKDNNYRVSNNCFDKTTQTAITSILDGYSTFNFQWNS